MEPDREKIAEQNREAAIERISTAVFTSLGMANGAKDMDHLIRIGDRLLEAITAELVSLGDL